MFDSTLQGLKQFCSKHHPIYLYGAGDFGKRYLSLLQCLGVDPAGFIVSGSGSNRELLDHPILVWSNVQNDLPAETGIILAVSMKHADSILSMLSSSGFDVFRMDDDDVRQLSTILTHEYIFMKQEANLKPAATFSKLDPRLPEWQSVLVMRLDLIGDNLEGMPFLRELRRNLPRSRIVMLARESLKDLYDCCPYVDELLYYDVDGWADLEHLRDFAERHLQNFSTVILTRLRSYPNDYTVEEMLLMLYSSARHRLAWDMKKSDTSYIHKEIFSRFFSFWDSIEEDMHHVQYMLMFLQDLGARIDSQRMEAWIGESAYSWADTWLKKQDLPSHALLIGVALVGSAAYKNYPPRLFQAVFQKLVCMYPQMVFLLLGGSDAVSAAKKLRYFPYILDLTGRTNLSQSLALMNKCSFYLGADTGLMHMAAALGKPVVQISSELPDARHEDTNAHYFSGAFGVPLKVCMARQGMDGCSRYCTMGRPHCITQISPDEIARAVEWMVEGDELTGGDAVEHNCGCCYSHI